MKRKTPLSATKIGALSVEAHSVELEDSNSESDHAPATPALLVRSIKFSGVTAGSKIKLTVPVMPDLYIETVTLIRGRSAEATLGTLSKGTRKGRGVASVRISAELYDFVLSQTRWSKLLITLEHTEARVTNIRFENIESPTVAQVANEDLAPT